MEPQWMHKADVNGWARWRRHVLVMLITVALNLLIFLTIPFLSQIREVQTDQPSLAGTPIRVSMPSDDPEQADPQEPRKPPEPPEPQKPPRPEFRPQQVAFSPPSPPDLPELSIDLPAVELAGMAVSRPEPPAQAEPKPQPSPEPAQAASKPEARPQPAAERSRFSLGEVDAHPRLVGRVNPTYPFRAKRRGVEGKVVLRFLVDKQGRVRELSVEQAEPAGVFEESALKAVRQWRFEPGEKDGKPVSTWVQVPIRFELSR